jgi:hypothetical protein
MKWIAALVVAAVGIANAEPEKKIAPFTADEMEHLAATTKPGQEIEVRTGFFITFHRMQASAKLKDGWHRAVSTGGAFSVEIPVKFNDLMMRVAATDGVEVRVDVLGGPVGTVKWAASCSRRKDGTRGPKNVKIEDKTERIGDRAWARRMELGPRICSLTVETTGTDPLPPEADIKRFFNSIKSTGKPTW